MRKPSVPAAIVLAVIVFAAVAAWADTAVFTPSEPGSIFTVINYKRVQGRVQPTSVTLDTGASRKSRTVVPPYRICNTTFPAGFVLKMRNPRPSSNPLTLTTNGSIVRGPYSGDMPMELLHPCYKLVLF